MSSPAGTSPCVDGTDVFLVANVEEQIADFIWEEDWAEGPPKFHGGTMLDAMAWVKQLTEPYYIQYKDPFLILEN